jgi:pyruvate/2-oxoglutarate/acetoin dehydrogenase E1 component
MNLSRKTVASAINGALHSLFESDPRVLLVGEDLLDPYGGAFKISKGLSTKWPDRVLTTPISEAAIVGVCTGMALRGLRPIAEIMFGDFVTLAFDQIVNSASKFRWMYHDQARCPVVIRTPMGGRRGYGPTHSQSLEKYLVGVPGLNVIAVSPFHDLTAFYRAAVIESEDPTVIIENKVMYGADHRPVAEGRLDLFSVSSSGGSCATLTFSAVGFERADVTIVTYGGGAQLALQVAERLLIEEEIFVEVVVLGRLAPLPVKDLGPSVRRSGRVVTLEEGTRRLGVGAEIASLVAEKFWSALRGPVRRVAAADYIIPNTKPLEDYVLPGTADIERAIRSLMQS